MKAIPATVDTINRLGKPFAFVITQAPPRGPRVSEARVGLSMLGQVCPTTIVSRTTYQDASGTGKGVTEYDAASKAAIEIRTLWQWLQRHIKKRHHG